MNQSRKKWIVGVTSVCAVVLVITLSVTLAGNKSGSSTADSIKTTGSDASAQQNASTDLLANSGMPITTQAPTMDMESTQISTSTPTSPPTAQETCSNGSAFCGVQKLCCDVSETCYIQHPDTASAHGREMNRNLWEGQCISKATGTPTITGDLTHAPTASSTVSTASTVPPTSSQKPLDTAAPTQIIATTQPPTAGNRLPDCVGYGVSTDSCYCAPQFYSSTFQLCYPYANGASDCTDMEVTNFVSGASGPSSCECPADNVWRRAWNYYCALSGPKCQFGEAVDYGAPNDITVGSCTCLGDLVSGTGYTFPLCILPGTDACEDKELMTGAVSDPYRLATCTCPHDKIRMDLHGGSSLNLYCVLSLQPCDAATDTETLSSFGCI